MVSASVTKDGEVQTAHFVCVLMDVPGLISLQESTKHISQLSVRTGESVIRIQGHVLVLQDSQE